MRPPGAKSWESVSGADVNGKDGVPQPAELSPGRFHKKLLSSWGNIAQCPLHSPSANITVIIIINIIITIISIIINIFTLLSILFYPFVLIFIIAYYF